MGKPTTIRIPEDLLKEIDKSAKELHMDRSAYLREVLRKGLYVDKEERYLDKYRRGEMSMGEVCKALGSDPWEFMARLREKGIFLNVSLEDWLDSSRLGEK